MSVSSDRNGDRVNSIQIEVCSDLYNKWKHDKSWIHNVPRKAITTKIDYIDTKPNSGSDYPIILCLHGAPGSHSDFALLRERLRDYPIRIICPNWPTYSLTKQKRFGHYAEEKAEYMLDFLKALGIEKLSMIISHSSSIYPSMLIMDNPIGSSIRALVLLNPCGHRRIQAMKYPILDKTSAYFYQYKFFRFFIKHLGKPVLIITKCPVKLENMDNLFLSVATVTHSHYKRLSDRLQKLGERRDIDKLMIFSENDKLIQKDIFYEMAEMLGIESENLEVYDQNGVQTKEAHLTGYPKGIALQNGGHYAFISHSNIVNETISKMIEQTLLNNNVDNENDSGIIESSSESSDDASSTSS